MQNKQKLKLRNDNFPLNRDKPKIFGVTDP